MRSLSDLERLNVALLVRLNVQFGLLEQTDTSLKKGYSDATQEFREFLRESRVHDYARQTQGQEIKVIRKATLIKNGVRLPSEIAMDRPLTKHGDPRVRISHIQKICQNGDLAAVLYLEDRIFVIQLSESNFERELDHQGALRDLLGKLANDRLAAADELYEMILWLAKRGFMKTHRTGDTAVGHLLETELGIMANSSRAPDYKGIEIKSTRAKSQNRLTMFAKVPDWKLSSPKSTAQFLELFGYDRRGFPELNCEVSSKRVNSQGLRLRVSPDGQFLEEFSEGRHPTFILRWTLESLRTTLQRKHAETFWVKATSDLRSDGEYIRFDSIVHTSKPVLEQVAPLLSSGAITLDHLISKKPGKGVKEQGPLFKIATQEFDALFPRLREVDFSRITHERN